MSRLLEAHNAVLLVVDIQEKFVPVVHESQHLIERTWAMIQAARLLGLPIVVSEQYPAGLGATVKRLKDALPDSAHVMAKTAFSAMAEMTIQNKLWSFSRKQVLVCGIEAHICVNQTVQELLGLEYQVHVVADAVASRDGKNKAVGLEKMYGAGAIPSCTEMALFELMRDAKHPQFKKLQALIK